jgi:hypothetical protein
VAYVVPCAPKKIAAIILYERNGGAGLDELDHQAAVYSEAASTQAVQSNGERDLRLPRCTMVSGQIDLNTGGARVRRYTESDPDEKANPPQVTGLAEEAGELPARINPKRSK